jgi:lysophospholipase L1-like esterase
VFAALAPISLTAAVAPPPSSAPATRAAPRRQSAAVAAPRTDKNSVLAHEQLVAKAKAGGIDLYFLGDSITRRWGCTDPQWAKNLENWKENFFGWNAANFGWGADGIQNILWRIQNGELEGVHPKVIVILGGTNNVGNQPGNDEKVADILAGLRALIDTCREKAPQAKIILTAIFPRNDNLAVLPEIRKINEGLAKFADGKTIYYVNVNDKLAGPDGVLFDGMTIDKLHLSVKGYQVWADGLRPLLTKLLGPRAQTDHAPPATGDPSIARPAAATAPGAASLPHMQRNGDVTQLIVDGKPFLILGGEIGNSTASNGDAMAPVWPRLRRLHLNTVLAPVYWDLVEREEEGKFDFSLVDRLIDDARQNEMRLVLLWFGAWKNSMSTYAPPWVKQDWKRFPRALKHDGSAVEILSPFSAETLAADAAAFAALMRHLRDYDGEKHTVLMVQVENEIGMIPEPRDHSPAADAAFASAVPQELMDRLTERGDSLSPELRQRWQSAGGKTSGTWAEVCGATPEGEEVFSGWHFAKFVNELARRGKAEYPLPLMVNAVLNRPGRAPGRYPAGGPLPHLIDLWQIAAPHIDMISPDIYFFNFTEMTERYRRPNNPLFIPEAMRTSRASANAMYAIAQQDAIGFAPFGIEGIEDVETNLLAQTYGALAHLAPLILEHQARGETIGLSPNTAYDGSLDDAPQTIALGDNYKLTVRFAGGKRPLVDPAELTSGDPAMRGRDLPPAGGMIIRTGLDEYTVVGIGMTLTHAASDPSMQAGLLDVQEWAAREGTGGWQPHRWLNGDQTNQGREVSLSNDRVGMCRVRLYQYR